MVSDNRLISSVNGCFDCFDWLPKKMQDSRSDGRQIFSTRPYISRPQAAANFPQIVTHTFKVCKYLKIIKLKTETPCTRKIYDHIHIFKEKSNFFSRFYVYF